MAARSVCGNSSLERLIPRVSHKHCEGGIENVDFGESGGMLENTSQKSRCNEIANSISIWGFGFTGGKKETSRYRKRGLITRRS